MPCTFQCKTGKVTRLFSYDQDTRFSFKPGLQTIQCKMPPIPLTPGDYYLDAGIAQAANALSWDVLLKVPVFTVADELGHLEWANRPWGIIHPLGVNWIVCDLPPACECEPIDGKSQEVACP